ncbi:MAG: hypothetical protein ACTHKG_02200 [Nocardioides sp.]
MTKVCGFADGIYYEMDVDPEAEVIDSDRDPSVYGLATGSARVAGLLQVHDGQEFGETPTGPFHVLAPGDAASICAALANLTTVTQVIGDLPYAEPEPDSPDTVY